MRSGHWEPLALDAELLGRIPTGTAA